MSKEVFIIGGGASGLVAAIVSARQGTKVTVLERKDRIGKKILATGNGKCNFTNLYQEESCYLSEDNAVVMQSLTHFNVEQTIIFFEKLGILPKEKNGYLYPNSEQASSVLEVLKMEAEYLGVIFQCEQHVHRITHNKNSFQIQTNSNKYRADSVILATGGCATPDLGSDGSGYQLAKELGHTIIEVVPALTALHSPEHYFKAVSGVRTDAKILLMVEGEITRSESGELQLTNYGISGIPVFQISRFASKALKKKKKVSASIDFLPGMTEGECFSYLIERINACRYKTLEAALIGLLNKKLINVLIKEAGLNITVPASELTKRQISKLVSTIKSLCIRIDGTNAFENSQVCAGGVSLKEVNGDTMESKLVGNLYLAGELLDVDGICGGYNLQWAWTSGYLAGLNSSLH